MVESEEEEEPLERSLKMAMATPVVGCEMARARKRGSGYSLGRKEGRNRGNVTCGRGEKGMGRGG